MNTWHTLSSAATCISLLTGCAKPLTEAECFDLLDRYVSLLLQADNPGTSAAGHLTLQREARAKAARDPAFGECSERVSRSKFECALEASSPDALEQCLL